MPENTNTIKRYLEDHILRDLNSKMVFVAGPRQVGKTTLAKKLLGSIPGYMNWDIPDHREAILKRMFPDTSFWAFDEIHKYRKWRQLLKGLYDEWAGRKRILVTGSASLDYYRHGGDSLQGRYHFWRLHPLSCAELRITTKAEFDLLLRRGGFPEPFFASDDIDARRWSREYRTRLLHDDILGVEQIRDIGTLELLVLRLPDLVGSPLSINALREELQVNHATVSSWLDTLERMYAIFRLAPFGAPRIRAVKKERKHYHLDWSLVTDPGARFENLIACHLLKWVHFLQDAEGRDVELRYFRDTDGREVDFIVTDAGCPILCAECKTSRTDIAGSLRYFKQRFPPCRAVQLVAESVDPTVTADGIELKSAWDFLDGFV